MKILPCPTKHSFLLTLNIYLGIFSDYKVLTNEIDYTSLTYVTKNNIIPFLIFQLLTGLIEVSVNAVHSGQ